MHSVRIELAKLILVGTRITYQATGDVGIIPINSRDFCVMSPDSRGGGEY